MHLRLLVQYCIWSSYPRARTYITKIQKAQLTKQNIYRLTVYYGIISIELYIWNFVLNAKLWISAREKPMLECLFS